MLPYYLFRLVFKNRHLVHFYVVECKKPSLAYILRDILLHIKPEGLFLLGGRLEGRLGGSAEGGSSVNDRHSSVCEREGTPSHAAPERSNFQLSSFSIVLRNVRYRAVCVVFRALREAIAGRL